MKFLFDQVTTAAERFGVGAAFRSHSEVLSFEDFRVRVAGLAGALQKLGVKHGDRISILADNSIDYLAYLYAATQAGAFLHVINVRLAIGEMTWAVGDAESHLLIVDEHYADLIDPILAACKSQSLKVIGIGDIEKVDHLTTELIALDIAPIEVDQDPTDPIVLIYTSGTTGRPKGALQTHVGSLHADYCAGEAIQFSTDDRFLAIMPFFHQAGLIRPRANLVGGGETIIPGRMTPEQVCEAVRDHRVTVTMLASGGQLGEMTRMASETPSSFESVRLLISGGGSGIERMGKMKQACDLLGCNFMGVYGQTEVTGPATASIGAPCFERPKSCGTPLLGFEIAIWGDDQSVLPAGERGEVMVRGITTASYWRNSEANEALYTGDWLHTGDMGYLDEDGFLYLAGRIKELIKTGAENVYPREVEDVLLPHPAVRDLVIFGMPDEQWGEAVCAAVILEKDASLTLEEVKAYCQGKIGGYKIPKRLFIVEEIPRNATGKPVKHVLRKQLLDAS